MDWTENEMHGIEQSLIQGTYIAKGSLVKWMDENLKERKLQKTDFFPRFYKYPSSEEGKGFVVWPNPLCPFYGDLKNRRIEEILAVVKVHKIRFKRKDVRAYIEGMPTQVLLTLVQENHFRISLEELTRLRNKGTKKSHLAEAVEKGHIDQAFAVADRFGMEFKAEDFLRGIDDQWYVQVVDFAIQQDQLHTLFNPEYWGKNKKRLHEMRRLWSLFNEKNEATNGKFNGTNPFIECRKKRLPASPDVHDSFAFCLVESDKLVNGFSHPSEALKYEISEVDGVKRTLIGQEAFDELYRQAEKIFKNDKTKGQEPKIKQEKEEDASWQPLSYRHAPAALAASKKSGNAFSNALNAAWQIITTISLRKMAQAASERVKKAFSKKSNVPALEAGANSEAALEAQVEQILSKIEPHPKATIEPVADAVRIAGSGKNKEAQVESPSTTVVQGDELAALAADEEASLRESPRPFLSAQTLPSVPGSTPSEQPTRRLGQ